MPWPKGEEIGPLWPHTSTFTVAATAPGAWIVAPAAALAIQSRAGTVAFCLIVAGQMGALLSCRSDTRPAWEMLEFPNFYFIANNTPKFETEAMSQFRNQFYDRYFIYPGMNSILGLELVYWLGSNSKPTFGYDLRRSLDQSSFQPGKLTWGFNFQNSNNNSYSPLFKMEAGELIPLK